MARRPLPYQQELLTNLLIITEVRARVEHLLEHVTRLQSESISLADAYGIKQADIADVVLLSRPRVGQIAAAVDPTEIAIASVTDQIHQVEEWPGDVMSALAEEVRQERLDDPEYRAAADAQIGVVYGAEEVARRAAGRERGRTDPEWLGYREEAARRRQRTIYGADEAARRLKRDAGHADTKGS